MNQYKGVFVAPHQCLTMVILGSQPQTWLLDYHSAVNRRCKSMFPAEKTELSTKFFLSGGVDSFTAYHGLDGVDQRRSAAADTLPQFYNHHLPFYLFMVATKCQQIGEHNQFNGISTGFCTLIADGIRPITCPQNTQNIGEKIYISSIV